MTAVATRPAAIDARFVAPGTAHALACTRAALAVVLGVRLLLRDWSELAGRPDALYDPIGVTALLPSMPPGGVLTAIQVLGVAAAVAAAVGRRPAITLPVAWLGLLVLAGLRSSAGKVLHNDVLLLLAVVPFLFAPADARLGDERSSARWGWPRRAALLVVGAVYFACAVQKVRHSGWDWVAGDNMRWIMYGAAASGLPPTDAFALAIADRAWLAHVAAAGVFLGELLAPALLLWRRTRPWCALGALLLHGGTWLTLGLDYWAWTLTVAALCLPWERWWPARRLGT